MNIQSVSSSRSYNRLYDRLRSVNGLYLRRVAGEEMWLISWLRAWSVSVTRRRSAGSQSR